MKKVLIVEDHIELSEAIRDILEDYGHIVYEATGANEVIEKEELLLSELDFILTDIKMPTGTGLDLIQHVRKIDPDHKVKIIIMTGYTDLTESQLIDLGADYFYNKPIDVEEVIELINQ